MESIVTVCTVVFKDENILFVKSIQDGGKFKLTLPGAKLMDFENIEECAVRGVKETADIDIVLDKRLGGVITRRNKIGNFISTFIFLAETQRIVSGSSCAFIPYKDVEYNEDISDFSRVIISRLKTSPHSGIESSTLFDDSGKEYIMYF